MKKTKATINISVSGVKVTKYIKKKKRRVRMPLLRMAQYGCPGYQHDCVNGGMVSDDCLQGRVCEGVDLAPLTQTYCFVLLIIMNIRVGDMCCLSAVVLVSICMIAVSCINTYVSWVSLRGHARCIVLHRIVFHSSLDHSSKALSTLHNSLYSQDETMLVNK